jgi:hypothetical protein
MTPQNWIPLPGAITEDEISITLSWKASSRTRQALERQARLNQFDSITEFLLDAIQFKTCQKFFVPPVILPRFWPALVTVAPNVCDTNGGHSEEIWLHADCVAQAIKELYRRAVLWLDFPRLYRQPRRKRR